VLGFIPQPNLQGIHYQNWYNKLLPIGESVRVSERKNHWGGDNASGTLIVKALKPLNLKKDSGLLTGLSYS